MRALLDLLRDQAAAVQDQAALIRLVLRAATSRLKILDLKVGDKELIKEVAVEMAKLEGDTGVPRP